MMVSICSGEMQMMIVMMEMTGEIQRLRQEMESSRERWEREKESLHEKMRTAGKDYKAALQQAKHDHQQDVARLTDVHVSCFNPLMVT